MDGFVVNENKNEIIEVDGVKYRRLAIKTHVISENDVITDVAVKYVKDLAVEGDILFITEKIVGCTQGRAIPLKDINYNCLAHCKNEQL